MGRSLAVWNHIHLHFFFQATFTLIPDAQILPQYLNALIGGIAGLLYLAVNDIGILGGDVSFKFEFILGVPFLQRFICVFDSDNNQVGIANNPYTNDNVNVITRDVVYPEL
jgi:hypothetical protein